MFRLLLSYGAIFDPNLRMLLVPLVTGDIQPASGVTLSAGSDNANNVYRCDQWRWRLD